MSETIDKLVENKVHWIITVASVVVAIAAAFYTQSTKIAVLEERQNNLAQSLEDTRKSAAQYQSLAQNIDGRLSRIEGALGVVQIKQTSSRD